MKAFYKWAIWTMAYVGFTYVFKPWTQPFWLCLLINAFSIAALVFWFYSEDCATKTVLDTDDMDAIVFTKADIERLGDNIPIRMMREDGSEILFMSEECYKNTYEN